MWVSTKSPCSQGPMLPRPHVPRIDIVDNDNITKGPMLPNTGAICPDSLFSQVLGSSVFKASHSQSPMLLIQWVLCSQGPKSLRLYKVDDGNISKGPMFPHSWVLCSPGPKFPNSRLVCSEDSKFQSPRFLGSQDLGNHFRGKKIIKAYII